MTDTTKFSWRDTARWFWDLFGPIITLAAPAIVVWLGTWYVVGQQFARSTHMVSGFAIIFTAGVAGLCITLLAIHGIRWLKARRRPQPLAIEYEGPDAIWWHMGGMHGQPAMQIAGQFHITNRSPSNLLVSRTVIVIAYRRWAILPARRQVESGGLYEGLPARTVQKHCLLDFWVQPPLMSEGEHLFAKVCLIDNLGGESWSRWLRWLYR